MIKCTFTPKSFKQKVLEKAISIFENENLSDTILEKNCIMLLQMFQNRWDLLDKLK